MLVKLDWKDILLFLSSFLPALIKALQAALASGQKLDFVTVLVMVVPIFFMSLAVLKTPGSAAVNAALAAQVGCEACRARLQEKVAGTLALSQG